MRRQDATNACIAQRFDRWLDARFEQSAGEMQAANKTSDVGFPRQTLSVKQDVDRARVRTARDDHQAAVAHVDDESLVGPDHRIGLPAIRAARLPIASALREL